MKKTINLSNQEIEIEKFNIIFASDTIIEDWFYDSANNIQYLLFNNIWESFMSKIPKNVLEIVESAFSSISDPKGPLNFLEYFKNFTKIKQEISLLDSLNHYLIDSTIYGKNENSDVKELVNMKSKHIAQIINILKKYKESIQNKAGSFSSKDIEIYMKKKEDFNNIIVDLYNILTKTLSIISKYCSFNDSQDPYYFEEQTTTLTSLFEYMNDFHRNIMEFQESTEFYSKSNVLDTLVALFKSYNEKITRIEIKKQIHENIKSTNKKTIENFFPEINTLGHLQLSNVPEIFRLNNFEDIKYALETLLQLHNGIKEYYSEILQKIQMNTKRFIERSNIKGLLYENTEENKPLIDLINEPFQKPELIKEFCANLTIYEVFVQSIQNIHNLVSKIDNIFHKFYNRVLSITSRIYEASQSLLNFDTERQKKIKFLEEMIAHEDQIIQNEEKLLLLMESAAEKVELKNAFRSYHKELDSLELRIQSEKNSKINIGQLNEQIVKENLEISTVLKDTQNNKHAKEDFINSYRAFASFFDNIARCANRGLKDMDLYMDFSFKFEQDNHHLFPVINPIFLKKEINKWVLADTQVLMRNELIKEILLFSFVLNLSKIEFAKNRIFAYYFDSDLSNQERERLNKMVKSMINQEDIKNYSHIIMLFFNIERTFEIKKETIKIINLEEESE